MVDTKISSHTALTGANTAATDVFPIVDESATETKKITRTELLNAIYNNAQDIISASGLELRFVNSSTLDIYSSTQVRFRYSGGAINIGGSFSIGTTGTNGDCFLHRDAAAVFAQRNGAVAQTYRLYGTYTDTSNYRRLVTTMSTAGVAEIKPEGLGTGASGNVLHISGLPASNPGPGILWNDGGTVKVGT
jgi:hypothetical protein